MKTPVFRDPRLLRHFAEEIRRVPLSRPVRLMEVCGGHTAAIHRFALRDVLPKNIDLLSGPGCPVCVTTEEFLDRGLALTNLPEVTIGTFGDLMRVPGSQGTLAEAKASGKDVRIVYSPMEALDWARAEPKRLVIFLAIGFETTACTIAAVVERAMAERIANFRILSALKTMPAALRALLSDRDVQLDGFILPGHVMTVTGVPSFEFIAREFGVPCAVAGFEPADLLEAILLLTRQLAEGRAAVEIQYGRSVRYSGNTSAQAAMERTFEPCGMNWRGLGEICGSGLALRQAFAAWDAAGLVPGLPLRVSENGCRCGDVLRGMLRPDQCGLFGTACTPEQPRGACMVSSEGACAAMYHYAAASDE